jgi:autotransporter passenger strand-loop-strand repeat protein
MTVSTIVSGGAQQVFSGGTASGTRVSAGTQTISAGGTALGTVVCTVVYCGASASVLAGGVTTGTSVTFSGLETISGGTAVSTTVLNGGVEYIAAGTASGTVVQQGGIQDISGGTAIDTSMNGAAFVSGGTLELLSGALDAGDVTFAGPPLGVALNTFKGSGTLRIDGTTMPKSTIYNFFPGDTIDLADIPGGASGYTLLKPNNVLEIVENGQAFDLQLDTARTFALDGGFSLSADAQGNGTAVTFVYGAVTKYSPSAPAPLANSVPFNPYRSVVFVAAGNERGTGFIVGPHTILTAAHVVAGAAQITVYPGTEVGTGGEAYQADPVAPAYFDPAYQERSPTDFAIINVQQDLGGFGFFQLVPSNFWPIAVSVSGYPLTNDPFESDIQHNVIAQTDAGAGAYAGLLTLPTDTPATNGNSGSPLWTDNGNSVQAVGIMLGQTQGVPIAVPITPSLVQQVQAWEADYKTLGITIGQGQNAVNLILAASGEYLDVLPGGTVNGTTLDSGTVETVFGIDNNATINDGATQYIDQGGIAFNTDVADPGLQVVSSGGTAVSATLSDGEQDVFGVASSTTVESGGLEIVESGGTASGTVVETGGTLELLGGAVAPGFKINSGGVIEIAAGYTLGGYQVASGVTLDVASGGRPAARPS